MNIAKMPYFNHRNYILSEIKHLDITIQEAFLLLYIDFCNEFQMEFTMELASENLGLSMEEVDELIANVIQVGYLEMEMVNGKVVYNMDQLFTMSINNEPVNKKQFMDLFELYEDSFGRPLSQSETAKLSEWMTIYDLQLIDYALREAIVYNKVKMEYVEAILRAWKNKGFTKEDYEKGDR
ncbi:DNA replication protein [Breznakia blatticola]|uniref:DNA replication protein n=1 Tax=Breznakia blatticola TaxID=1754012 RepID=A0A4R8A6N9_9FIRM|nr:DnaD domain protein [Breznakia blatticola]TDW26342.1 DNA replication protein [Breznakia blatticola]